MDSQTFAAAVLVVACSVRALWMFLPQALRSRCRRRLGRPQAQATSACGSGGACGACGGCGTGAPGPGAAQVVALVRRPRGG